MRACTCKADETMRMRRLVLQLSERFDGHGRCCMRAKAAFVTWTRQCCQNRRGRHLVRRRGCRVAEECDEACINTRCVNELAEEGSCSLEIWKQAC